MTSLGYLQDFKVKPGNNTSYIDGRYGDIFLNGAKIGEIGEINPEVLLKFKLEFPIAAMEINLHTFI